MPGRPGTRPVVRRKALFVAAATLCAPALCALALAAFAATGGGDKAAMDTLAGTPGLHGTTTPTLSAPAPANQDDIAFKKSDSSDSASGHRVQKHPAAQAPPRSPAPHPTTKPAPTKPTHTAPAPHVNSPSVPTYDPNGPGSTTTSGSGSGSTTGTDGTSGTGTTTSGTGSTDHHGGGTADGYDAYPGGG